MTPAEAQALLGIAATFDNRKPDDGTAAKAWSVALGDIQFFDARDAIVAHYTESTEWLMPPHIVARVRRIRAKRIADAGDPTPPPDLSPLETIQWLKSWRRAVGDGNPPDTAYGELRPRNMPDLLQLTQRPEDPS